LAADITIQPKSIGHLACSVPGPLHTKVSVKLELPEQQVDVNASARPQTVGSDLNVDLSATVKSLKLKAIPPPIVAILSQNPQLIMECSTGLAVAGLAARLKSTVREDLIQDTFDVPNLAGNWSIPIHPIKVSIAKIPYVLTPRWEGKAILFSLTN